MLIKIESIRCPDVPVYCPDAFGIAVRILRNMHLDKSNNELRIDEQTINGITSFKVWINVKKIFENDLGKAKVRGDFVDNIIKKDQRLINYKSTIDDNLDAFNDAYIQP